MRIAYIILLLGLVSCEGSENYQGSWFATNRDGEHFDIEFDSHFFSVVNDSGDSSIHKYSQHSYKYENSVTTYGIKLEDGRNYNVFFPFAKDSTKAVIQLESQEVLYTLCRDSFILFEDIYALGL